MGCLNTRFPQEAVSWDWGRCHPPPANSLAFAGSTYLCPNNITPHWVPAVPQSHTTSTHLGGRKEGAEIIIGDLSPVVIGSHRLEHSAAGESRASQPAQTTTPIREPGPPPFLRLPWWCRPFLHHPPTTPLQPNLHCQRRHHHSHTNQPHTHHTTKLTTSQHTHKNSLKQKHLHCLHGVVEYHKGTPGPTLRERGGLFRGCCPRG